MLNSTTFTLIQIQETAKPVLIKASQTSLVGQYLIELNIKNKRPDIERSKSKSKDTRLPRKKQKC
ncbi:MAG: hypothetical protein WA110_07770 [Anaerolineaceae bacterium]